MRKSVLSLILLIFYKLTFACGNEYEEGTSISLFPERKKVTEYNFINGFNTGALRMQKEDLENKLSHSNDYKLQSDYALVLLKLGEKKKALNILEELIKDHPQEYNIVANLGTAYELNGNTEKALHYIQEAVRINPSSHQGSEWIHVQILNAKLKNEQNKLIKNYSNILNLNIEKEKFTKSEKEILKKVREEIIWQLEERIKFIAPNDPIVASLLFDLGRIIEITDNVSSAIPVYNLSLKYYPLNFDTVLKRRDEAYSSMITSNYLKITLIISLSASLVFLIIILRNKIQIRKLIQKHKQKELLLKKLAGHELHY